MQFSKVHGYSEIKQVLAGSVNNGHIAHAQLFAGPEGTPTLAMALAYATFVCCTNRSETDSCGTCASCTKYARLIHPDLHLAFPVSTSKQVSEKPTSDKYLPQFRNFFREFPFGNAGDWAAYFGAENKQLNINVDEARNIIRTLSLKSFESEYKIMLIWLPEMMNMQAANALLKLLEEPAPKTLFCLVCSDVNKLLATIISRCQIISFAPYTNQEITDWLIATQQLKPKEANLFARLADGNMREALRVMNEGASDYFPFFTKWMRLCFGRRFIELMDLADEFQKLGREGQKSLIAYTISMIRESLIYRLGITNLVKLPDEEFNFVSRFSQSMTELAAEQVYEILNDSYYHIERNASAKIVFFDSSIQICSSFTTDK